MSLKKYTLVPGRGLLTTSAIQYRKDFLNDKGIFIPEIEKTGIEHADIQNNIESLVGSIEIPMGLVGPLTYNTSSSSEEVYCLGATLEGALIASMNRGAKAVSMSGGFSAEVIHQKMIRSPLFILSSEEKAEHFANWIEVNFNSIKTYVENYSNHANLMEIHTSVDNVNVHANFVYSTGDAAGQNMTTTCTWHGILWIVEEYHKQGYEKIDDFVLEGNGSSDKKVSQFLIDHGRGTKVVAKALVQEEAIQKILRTSSDQMLKFYWPSRKYAVENGMVGYTINASNAVAAIFAATGQDLGSIHESSVAQLDLKKHPEGLEVSLTLYSLVIGSIGGGTHLKKQREALELMGCYGSGKIERFASLIAGFVLGLELSTFAAMVSGEFAKAHEKLGRNKPVDWLQWNELNEPFVKTIVEDYIPEKIEQIEILKSEVDNGILMNLSKKVNRKLLGFIPINIQTQNNTYSILLKSKATDLETIKGLHLMAASIDPNLSDLITKYKDFLEYKNTHIKELEIPKFLNSRGFIHSPAFFGSHRNDSREIYLLAQERLFKEDLLLFDDENHPEKWDHQIIRVTISAIHQAHQLFLDQKENYDGFVQEFDINNALELYQYLINIAVTEDSKKERELQDILNSCKSESPAALLPKTLLHNDFNPRNIAVRNDGNICIYDWELAVHHYPHRDIVELLSFAMNEVTEKELIDHLKFHHQLWGGDNFLSWKEWKKGYIITLREYVLSRVLFYMAAEVVMKLKFAQRVYSNSIKMLNILENDPS